MSETRVAIQFGEGFSGVLEATHAKVPVGREEGALLPYDLLLGALGTCYYATFLDIVRKMRLDYECADIEVRGVKREEVPTTLKDVTLRMTLYGAEDSKGFARAAELAAKYCSVYETVSRVANIERELIFAQPDS